MGTVFSTLATMAMMAIGFLLAQIAQAYIWDGKNEDGTIKAPWAPSPPHLPWYWNGYKEFQTNTYRALTYWSQQLGSIYSIKMFQKRVIVLNHASVVRKALVELDQWNSSRPLTTDAIETIMGDQGKTVFTAQFTAHWGRLRRAINKVLRDAPVVLDVVGKDKKNKKNSTMQQFQNVLHQGKVDPTLLRTMTNRLAMEAVIHMVMGEQSKLDPEWIDTLIQVCHDIEQLQSSRWYYQYGSLVPFVRTLGLLLGGQHRVVQLRNKALDILLQMDPITNGNSVPTSLSNIEPSKNDPTPEPIPAEEIMINTLHLIMHGYCLLATSFFTLLQRLAQQSPIIQQQMATNPAWTTSFVAETLRYTPPLRLYTHTAKKDHTMEWQETSYRVDEGTYWLINLDKIHFDASYYPNPYQFDPERFLMNNKDQVPSILDDEKRTQGGVKDHLAFGVGRRGCLGSRASQRWMVTLLTRIVQEYELRGGDPDTLVDHSTGIWSWTGRTETKGATIEFIKKTN
ncbi:cytochrome P450 [Phascolomyces articulosus]|uniref:Cytochrome P450 n=1 Tax=Phascolomyces articulosus TaxID=60185 RepID=A0AAD5KB11_9FUNG|nr:cytochrome P450 [Phascolomyces articulosus]